MDSHLFLTFAITTAIVIFSPGPTAILVASRGAAGGLRQALITMIGVSSATTTYFVLSATGIAALITASYALFSIVKWIGVAYLLYLGLTAIFSPAGGIQIRADMGVRKSIAKSFAHGFMVEFSNPKALLFFSSILPQFVDPARPIAQQFIMMGVTSALLQVVIYGSYGLLGERLGRGTIKRWVVSMINKAAGAALIFAGLRMAATVRNN